MTENEFFLELFPQEYELLDIKDFKDFGVASFSIMPETDTPEVLKQYAEDYNVTNPNWNFLTI